MTKKQQQMIARKQMWNTAIAEGRMLRSQGGLSFCPFATRAEALQAVQRIVTAGMEADIVDPSLADAAYVVSVA